MHAFLLAIQNKRFEVMLIPNLHEGHMRQTSMNPVDVYSCSHKQE